MDINEYHILLAKRRLEEELLYRAISRGRALGLHTREVVPMVAIHPKRAWYLLDKWSGRGWYDYGVSAAAGWTTYKHHPYSEESSS